MKNHALLSLKDKRTKLKCRLLQFLFGALRVNSPDKASQSLALNFAYYWHGLVVVMKIETTIS